MPSFQIATIKIKTECKMDNKLTKILSKLRFGNLIFAEERSSVFFCFLAGKFDCAFRYCFVLWGLLFSFSFFSSLSLPKLFRGWLSACRPSCFIVGWIEEEADRQGESKERQKQLAFIFKFFCRYKFVIFSFFERKRSLYW